MGFPWRKRQDCSTENDEALIRSLRKQGASPRFTVLSGQGHAIAGVYKNQELYDWFLSNTRISAIIQGPFITCLSVY